MDVARRVTWRDLLVPVALGVLGTAELAALGTSGWVAAAGLEWLAAGVLVFRRSHPLVASPIAAILILSITYTGTRMDEPATPIIYYIVAVYALGRYAGRRGAPVALAMTLLLVVADLYFVNSDDNDVTDVMFVLSLAIPPYIFGRVARKMAAQSEQLKRQQALIRDQAVRDERDRIARELHDVIAHSLSAMVVQTAAAEDLVSTHPDRAAELLASVAETGRKALAETGRLLHLIRDDADELGLRPAPGLADLPELVSSFRDSGLAVETELALPAVPLAGGVDVSAYRVVQEALTNALKYGDGPVRLRVCADAGRLRISCVNPVGTARANGSGLGIQGMAERVALLGGTIRSGPTTDAGFVIDVDIPLRTGAEA